MSGREHTPGEWIIDYGEGIKIRDRDGGAIASLSFTGKGGKFGGRRDEAEVLANAELIARAVNSHATMLAALKELLADMEEMLASPEHLEMALSLAKSGHPVVTPDAAPKTFRDARAAIAAAEREDAG